MTMSADVQAAIYGRPEDRPKLGVSPVQVSKHGGDLYEFRFGKFHIYHHELDVGYCARKLLDNGWGPQGLETMFADARRQFDALQEPATDVSE